MPYNTPPQQSDLNLMEVGQGLPEASCQDSQRAGNKLAWKLQRAVSRSMRKGETGAKSFCSKQHGNLGEKPWAGSQGDRGVPDVGHLYSPVAGD